MTNGTGRYWLVWEDDTPEAPGSPYAENQLSEAYDRMRELLRQEPDAKVEIRQCSDEELLWAGIGDESDYDEDES